MSADFDKRRLELVEELSPHIVPKPWRMVAGT